MRRRRRKQRVLWLPNVGTPEWGSAAGEPAGFNPSYLDFNLAFTLGGGRVPTFEFVLFQDGPGSESFQLPPASPNEWEARGLNTMLEWGYRLRRIVGKLHISAGTPVQDQTQVAVEQAGVICTAGIIVRRIDQQLPNQSLALTAGDITTDSPENIRDPWIWRRSWPILNAQVGLVAGSDPTGATQAADMVLSGSMYGPSEGGSVLDGPHVDAKTARIIGPEERVFLNLTFRERFLTGPAPIDWDCSVFFDYRGLASLRSSSGNRRNATR